MDALSLLKPEPVRICIYGEEHEVRRLRLPTATKAMGLLAQVLTADGGACLSEASSRGGGVDPMRIVDLLARGGEAAGQLLDLLLRESFPTFKGWDDLPMDHALALAGEVWRVNDVKGMIARFFGPNPTGREGGTSGT